MPRHAAVRLDPAWQSSLRPNRNVSCRSNVKTFFSIGPETTSSVTLADIITAQRGNDESQMTNDENRVFDIRHLGLPTPII